MTYTGRSVNTILSRPTYLRAAPLTIAPGSIKQTGQKMYKLQGQVGDLPHHQREDLRTRVAVPAERPMDPPSEWAIQRISRTPGETGRR